MLDDNSGSYMLTPLSVLLKSKNQKLHFASPDDTCTHCAKKMADMCVGALLVIEHDKLIGIVSERDFLKKITSENRDPNVTFVKQIMTPSPLTLPPTATVQEAMKIITEKRFRHVPIMDNNHLIGMISIGDLTKWLMLQQEKEINALKGYIQG